MAFKTVFVPADSFFICENSLCGLQKYLILNPEPEGNYKMNDIKDSKTGIVGDNAKVKGGIHFHNHPVRLSIVIVLAIALLVLAFIFSGKIILHTTGDQSPAIIGNDATVTYGSGGKE